MGDYTNSGIHVGAGGTFNAGAAAAGTGARAVNTGGRIGGTSLEDLRAAAAGLCDVLRLQAAGPDAGLLLPIAEAVDAEASLERPEPGRLRRLLAMLTAGAGSTAAVAAAVDAVHQAASGLF